jgi:hypothetical protein
VFYKSEYSEGYTMQTAGEILQSTTLALYRDKVKYTNTSKSIELPAAIDDLIDDKKYRPKFAKMIREGWLNDLLELAEIAKEQNKPSHWFAKYTSLKNRERTRKWLEQIRQVRRNAAEVIRRLKAKTSQYKAVYAACWKKGSSVISHAINAQEIGRDKFKLFCWLVWRNKSEPIKA